MWCKITTQLQRSVRSAVLTVFGLPYPYSLCVYSDTISLLAFRLPFLNKLELSWDVSAVSYAYCGITPPLMTLKMTLTPMSTAPLRTRDLFAITGVLVAKGPMSLFFWTSL